jgi:hypothetical protein
MDIYKTWQERFSKSLDVLGGLLEQPQAFFLAFGKTTIEVHRR